MAQFTATVNASLHYKQMLTADGQTDRWTDVTGNAGSHGKSREQVPIWRHLAHLTLICDVVPSYFMVLFCKVTQKSHNLPRREQGEESFYSSHDSQETQDPVLAGSSGP